MFGFDLGAFARAGKWVSFCAVLALMSSCSSSSGGGGGGGGGGDDDDDTASGCSPTRVYFLAATEAAGTELWSSDGTASGTAMVKDIRSGSSSGAIWYLGGSGMVVDCDRAHFVGNDGVHGAEPWVSDGTEDSTVMVDDIAEGDGGSMAAHPQTALLDGTVYFGASDGTAGVEPYRSDGSTVERLEDIRPGGGDSSPKNFTSDGGTVYFSADDGGDEVGEEVWAYDGSTLTAIDIYEGTSSSAPGSLLAIGDVLFVEASEADADQELYVVEDGTPTKIDISDGASSAPASAVAYDGEAYFSAATATDGRELWRSNGGAVGSGTEQVDDIYDGETGSSLSRLTVAAGLLFFVANDGMNGAELWKVEDGDVSLVKDINEDDGDASPANLAAGLGKLFFTANDGTRNDVWVTDGTSAGTINLTGGIDMTPNFCDFNFHGTVGDDMIFSLDSDNDGAYELWRTDGTSAGTESIGPDLEVESGVCVMV